MSSPGKISRADHAIERRETVVRRGVSAARSRVALASNRQPPRDRGRRARRRPDRRAYAPVRDRRSRAGPGPARRARMLARPAPAAGRADRPSSPRRRPGRGLPRPGPGSPDGSRSTRRPPPCRSPRGPGRATSRRAWPPSPERAADPPGQPSCLRHRSREEQRRAPRSASRAPTDPGVWASAGVNGCHGSTTVILSSDGQRERGYQRSRRLLRRRHLHRLRDVPLDGPGDVRRGRWRVARLSSPPIPRPRPPRSGAHRLSDRLDRNHREASGAQRRDPRSFPLPIRRASPCGYHSADSRRCVVPGAAARGTSRRLTPRWRPSPSLRGHGRRSVTTFLTHRDDVAIRELGPLISGRRILPPRRPHARHRERRALARRRRRIIVPGVVAIFHGRYARLRVPPRRRCDPVHGGHARLGPRLGISLCVPRCVLVLVGRAREKSAASRDVLVPPRAPGHDRQGARRSIDGRLTIRRVSTGCESDPPAAPPTEQGPERHDEGAVGRTATASVAAVAVIARSVAAAVLLLAAGRRLTV